ncbi:MAG: AMP-binding protein [Treponema sp.]|nr:AMP-binding protein [Candidatus Treponema equifaecale]
MKTFSKFIFGFLSVVYPLVVFGCLVVFKVPVKVFSLFIVFFGLVYVLLATGGGIKKNGKLLITAGLLLSAGLICLFTGQTLFIKLYPVIMNLIFLFTFGSTLFAGPNMCFRFACMTDKSLENSEKGKAVEKYCRKVTVIWCVFFILNGLAALYTVLSNSDIMWSIYNGGISYGLMGLLFAVELIVRRGVNKKMAIEEQIKKTYITNLKADSWPMDHVICYEGKWSDNKHLTWGEFLVETAKVRAYIRSQDEKLGNPSKYILHSEDYWHFMCFFVALLQCKKEVQITANISPNFIAEMRGVEPGSDKISEVRFITDQSEVNGQKIFDSDYIPDILKNAAEPSEEEKMTMPQIVAEETRVMMFTSGSTGHPKTVPHTMVEFERDCDYVITRWYDEWVSRKVCAVNSHHHIYGFLYTLMPFAAGTPFRRTRIEFPDEFKNMDDVPYLIVAVPAFLKRTIAEITADDPKAKLPLKTPWIFSSGGAVSPELARDTERVFGFCPMEGYGSTETSAIAYRQQSVDGPLWNPIHTAKLWTDKDDGCLIVISPYIKDPKGFKTGDLVDIQPDGRFILKGRADSIVKIEEKRISTVEVENRLMQTGLVHDCSVVPMSDRRQYLAAAVVLSAEGKKKFEGVEKYLINRHFHDYLLQYFENVVLPKKWRYLEEIPMDAQGKKKKPEIQKLFAPENIHGIPAETVLVRREMAHKIEVEVEVLIPASSDYFDGHFPDFKLLPAVAQIDLVAHFAQRYFGTKLSTPDVKRFKFSEKLLPDSLVVFCLTYEFATSKISFEIRDFTGAKVYASGSYVAEKE